MLLTLLVPEDSAALILAGRLREGGESRQRPLGDSLPGLGTAGQAGAPFRPGDRSLGALARADFGSSWPQLAARSVDSLAALPGIGSQALEGPCGRTRPWRGWTYRGVP